MRSWIFDVDGVLCDTGCKIDPVFRDWFIDWSKDKEYYIITGGARESTIEQVGLDIVNNAKIQAHCMGNHIFIEGREYRLNQFTLNSEEISWLNNFIQESGYQIKTGNHIEQRIGSVNVSVVGRNASIDERNMFIEWDTTHSERTRLATEFVKEFTRFEAYLGGNTSVDICLRGANKGACLSLLPIQRKDTYFFGDKCFPTGIDYPVSRKLKFGSFQIDNGYNETWERLRTL